MLEIEAKKYTALNKLADSHGIVLFGGAQDLSIPLCELRQAFSIDAKMYNRSFHNLSIINATDAYKTCVAPINPETVFLHIGMSDLKLFEQNPTTFDEAYRNLINTIKAENKKCQIVVINLKNPENSDIISSLNRHLKYIANAEQCEFGDICQKRVWNPRETKDIVSFVYSTGFVRPLKNKRPIFDLIKILFFYEQSLES